MARQGQKNFSRKIRHTDLSADVRTHDEDFLFDLVDRVADPLLLILDGIQDPHNLGACLRTADAAGAHAVVIPRHRAVSLTETVRKVACGGAENVPLVTASNLAQALARLSDLGVRIVGTADSSRQTLYDIDLKGPLALVLGAEGTGMRKLTHDRCTDIAQIPMAGSVSCLNVSVAAGVCLFETVRQRIRQ